MLFNKKLQSDKIWLYVFLSITVFVSLLIVIIGAGLVYKSAPIINNNSFLSLLTQSEWYPAKGKFGMLPFILSTFWVTFTALLIAFPLCLLTTIYLTEYSKKSVLRIVSPILDILSGLPSVVYGVWGIIIVVPFVKNYIAPIFNVDSSGYTILTGSIVLAVMILPIIIHIMVEVFRAIPVELREASLSLGATKWETVKKVVLRKSLSGIIAAVVLGLSRAFGETIAVLMVVGNLPFVPHSILDPAYPLPALIANNYGEMLSIPLYDSALLFSALILFIIIIFFNSISRLILLRIEKSMGVNLSE